jgi:hypothetical protein
MYTEIHGIKKRPLQYNILSIYISNRNALHIYAKQNKCILLIKYIYLFIFLFICLQGGEDPVHHGVYCPCRHERRVQHYRRTLPFRLTQSCTIESLTTKMIIAI